MLPLRQNEMVLVSLGKGGLTWVCVADAEKTGFIHPNVYVKLNRHFATTLHHCCVGFAVIAAHVITSHLVSFANVLLLR